tara:strand:- start:692 stop:1876 length:1185 start_codon:yes stop_codon:yes gene_type:complete
MANLSGLISGFFTDIDVVDSIAINGDIGTANQVLTSDGTKTSYENPTVPAASALVAAGTGITITTTGNPETIATNVKSLVLSGTAVVSTPQTFNPNANGGSQTITINDTNTEYTGTEPIDISAGNAISIAYDDDTIILDGGELAVDHVPNALTSGSNISFSSGTKYDGSAGIIISGTDTTYAGGNNISIDTSANPDEIDLDPAITAMTGLTYLDNGASTVLTGSTYAQKETVATYLNLNSNTNIISPYFLHDVYDPSSTVFVPLTTSFVAIFSGNLKNSFVAKATSCVIELAIYNYAINGNRFLYLQLGDAAGDEWSAGTDGGGNGTGTRTTARLTHYPDETDRQTVRISYLLTGLTIGNTYVINPMAKTQSVINYIAAGGGYPNCILRGYYLP